VLLSGRPRHQGRSDTAQVPEAAPDPNAELRKHPGWWARLSGEQLDLQVLAESVRIPGLDVKKLDDHYYLGAEELQGASSEQTGDVRQRAEEILRVLNGSARVSWGSSREVHVDAVARVHGDGRIENFVLLSAAIESRSRVTASLTLAGQQQPVAPPSSLIDQLAAKGLADADAERALRIIGRDDVDYRDLYYVFEIAEEAIGGRMFDDGTVTQAEVSRFTRTAQSPTALGDTARHGRERAQPPNKPMPPEEALDLVRRVLRVWLTS
jgi:hypothetical protein